MSVTGRPASLGMSLMSLAVCFVNRRTRSSASRNSVAISVLFRRLLMSLFERESSSIFPWSSWFTVWSSSLVDWSSSFADLISASEVCTARAGRR